MSRRTNSATVNALIRSEQPLSLATNASLLGHVLFEGLIVQ